MGRRLTRLTGIEALGPKRKRCTDCTFFGVSGSERLEAPTRVDFERNDVSKGASFAGRLEIFTGAGRRRAWTAEQATIVAESLEDGALVSHVARRHGLTPQQVFAWRRQARREAEKEVGSRSIQQYQ